MSLENPPALSSCRGIFVPVRFMSFHLLSQGDAFIITQYIKKDQFGRPWGKYNLQMIIIYNIMNSLS